MDGQSTRCEEERETEIYEAPAGSGRAAQRSGKGREPSCGPDCKRRTMAARPSPWYPGL